MDYRLLMGKAYPSNEHYYQSEKTLDETAKEYILRASSPGEAKKRGNDRTKVKYRPDWEGDDPYKLVAMMNGIRMKFSVGSELADKLLRTEDRYLVEYAPWGINGDTFWGVNKHYKGQNRLGKLLMQRRKELSKQP